MSSGFERPYSMEEWKKLNQPPEMQVSPPPCPTAEQWNSMLSVLTAQYHLLEDQANTMERMHATIWKMASQAETLTKEVEWTRQLLQQAGNKKEGWLSLPKIPLPQPSLMWLWAIPALVALWVMWYASGTILTGLSQMAQLLP